MNIQLGNFNNRQQDFSALQNWQDHLNVCFTGTWHGMKLKWEAVVRDTESLNHWGCRRPLSSSLPLNHIPKKQNSLGWKVPQEAIRMQPAARGRASLSLAKLTRLTASHAPNSSMDGHSTTSPGNLYQCPTTCIIKESALHHSSYHFWISSVNRSMRFSGSIVSVTKVFQGTTLS